MDALGFLAINMSSGTLTRKDVTSSLASLSSMNPEKLTSGRDCLSRSGVGWRMSFVFAAASDGFKRSLGRFDESSKLDLTHEALRRRGLL